ncbi:hypothetical protein N9850_04200 [Granulosicoccus sp.]|nr:hypothetical protein [Granulosicoccus sp.]MDB4222951.1 hypothetical protein [Granulosicoccus sp.]
MSETITFEEFRAKISNLSTSDEELASYFTELPPDAQDKPDTGPRVALNIDKVMIEGVDDPRVEAAVLFDGANTLARFRRRMVFRDAVKKSTTKDRKILVTEGDSWFQFPFLIKDVVDHLSDSFNVYSVGAAGDTTRNMVFKSPEYIEALLSAEDIAGRQPDGLVFSSGGNDLLGMDGEQRVLARIVRPHQPNESVDIATAFNTDLLQEQLDLVRNGYSTLIEEVGRTYPTLPIFIHGYDRVFPFNKVNGDTRKGRWIQPPLSEQGVTQFADQRKITDHLIGLFRGILSELDNENQHVHFMETGQPLADDVSWWHDEIHATSDGFARVTETFTETINGVLATPT